MAPRVSRSSNQTRSVSASLDYRLGAGSTVMLMLMMMYQPLATQDVLFGRRPRPRPNVDDMWARMMLGRSFASREPTMTDTPRAMMATRSAGSVAAIVAYRAKRRRVNASASQKDTAA